MQDVFELVFHYSWVLLVVLAIGFHKLFLRAFTGTVIVAQDEVGIVNKKWVLMGRNRTLPDGSLIALNGEAGIQADTLAPGVHFGLWAWQYAVILVKFTKVEQGKVGVVVARDGIPMSGGRVLAKTVACNSFQDARTFLKTAGERGPQIAIIPPGTYRINTELFTVTAEPATEIHDNMVGVVTTKDGTPLVTGDIAGREVTGHNMYQDAETFIANGGYKGLQEQVILAGRYYINPRFATVEERPMTEVPIASVGVVIAYVGKEGKDVTGEGFKHGNLVSKGEKGVCFEPLDPGRYPINPYTRKVEIVPTANIVLNWADSKTEAHKLDANLCTITVRSSDGFTFNLDVSQIIHVPRNDAPKVIAQFGTMANLVTQVLEPTIGNYFRNAAQTSDVIEFLKSRTERQTEASAAIKKALLEYNVNAVDTLIGDISPPEALMKTLTDRKIAEQEATTYETQRQAQVVRKELQQASATAETQATVVNAQRQVEIREFEAQSVVKKAEGESKARIINANAEAATKTTIATADATVVKTVGDAEASKVRAIGTAEADVVRLKIASMDSDNYALVQIVQALSSARMQLVPQIVAGGSGEDGGSSGGFVNVLLAQMVSKGLDREKLSERIGADAIPSTPSVKKHDN